MAELSATSWVAVLHLLRPQGRRGELLAEPLTDQDSVLAPGRELWLAAEGSLTPRNADDARRLEEAWQPTGRNAGRWVVKLAGCDSIAAAEALAGQDLLLPASALPALDPDTFFVRDLIGCMLFDGDQPVGAIVGVEYMTGPDGRRLDDMAPLLAVEPAPDPSTGSTAASAPREPELVPFRRAWLQEVDLTARRIVMHLPQGLLDTP